LIKALVCYLKKRLMVNGRRHLDINSLKVGLPDGPNNTPFVVFFEKGRIGRNVKKRKNYLP
jgi:hypothetical protein